MNDEQRKIHLKTPTKEQKKGKMSGKNKQSEDGILCGEVASGGATNSDYSSPLIRMLGKVNGRPAELMIDSGSSSNFLSSSFVRLNRMKTEKLEKEQTVQLADGREHIVKRMVRKASVRWEGWSGLISFLVLPLSHYDIILGMKWLKEFNPKIDWSTGKCYAITKEEGKIEKKQQAKVEFCADSLSYTNGDVKHSISSLALSGNDMQSYNGKEIERTVLNLLSENGERKFEMAVKAGW